MRLLPVPLALALTLASCGDTARLGVEAGIGPTPVLPKPVRSTIPTVVVADATGWSPGQMPVAAPGLRVQPFAEGLDHPRWLHVLPNGDVLVAESASPGTDKSGKGIKGFFMKCS